MGWRGSGGGGAAIVYVKARKSSALFNHSGTGCKVHSLTALSGILYFFGGVLQIIGSIMEWIIGNTFPFVVFGTFGKAQTRSARKNRNPS